MQNVNYFGMMNYKMPNFSGLYLVPSKMLKNSRLGGGSEGSFGFFAS
jgi:hypothetical protein